MNKKIMHIFTRSPLHIGAGSSVGAIDLPVVRERHTRTPIIPGTSLKGVLASLYEPIPDGNKLKRSAEAEWLFGNEDSNNAASGALIVGEGRLVAFPVRSAKNAFAWVTCPLALARYKRDCGLDFEVPSALEEHDCLAVKNVLANNERVVLEEYCFTRKGDVESQVVEALKAGMPDDPVWGTLGDHLVILSDGLFSYFAEHACLIAHRIRIDDFTGTVAKGALFNQENVPSESMFYAQIGATNGRGGHREKTGDEALSSIAQAVSSQNEMIQLGGDATTGHGWCSVTLKEVQQ